MEKIKSNTLFIVNFIFYINTKPFVTNTRTRSIHIQIHFQPYKCEYGSVAHAKVRQHQNIMNAVVHCSKSYARTQRIRENSKQQNKNNNININFDNNSCVWHVCLCDFTSNNVCTICLSVTGNGMIEKCILIRLKMSYQSVKKTRTNE